MRYLLSLSLFLMTGLISSLALAQEPSLEETVAWLEKKIPIVSVGCITQTDLTTQKHGSVEKGERRFLGNAIEKHQDHNFYVLEMKDTHRAEKPGEVNEISNNQNVTKFDPASIGFVSIIEPLNLDEKRQHRVPEMRINEKYIPKGTYDGWAKVSSNCVSLKMEFTWPQIRVYDGVPYPRTEVSINVNDLQLATRLKESLEHWAKLSQASENEPYFEPF